MCCTAASRKRPNLLKNSSATGIRASGAAQGTAIPLRTWAKLGRASRADAVIDQDAAFFSKQGRF